MNRNTQKWYDKPVTKIILITIAFTWIFPVFGFVLSSFRPGEAIKETHGGMLFILVNYGLS